MSKKPIPAPASPAAPPVALARPSWLPPHVPYNDNWDTFIRALYIIFERDFKQGYPRFRTLPIWHNRRIEREDKYQFEEAFWHLVTRYEWVYNRSTRHDMKERYPDPERAGRLPWAKPILDYEADSEVTAWDCDEEAHVVGGLWCAPTFG